MAKTRSKSFSLNELEKAIEDGDDILIILAYQWCITVSGGHTVKFNTEEKKQQFDRIFDKLKIKVKV